MSKKLVFITTRLFWPADSGRKVSLYHYCKGLHERLGYDVYIYSFLEGDQTREDASEHPSFITDVRVSKPVVVGRKLKNLATALLKPSMPLQCALYWSKENSGAIREYCEEINPDVVIIDMVRLAPYMDSLDGLKLPVVLDYDDLLSKRYERQIGKSGGNVLGKYGTQACGLMRTAVSNPWLKNLVLHLESKRVERAEDSYARRADAVLFVSPIEASELNERLGFKKCFDATLGAEIVDLGESLPDVIYDLGFVGNMHTAANQASLDYICNEVLPLLPVSTLRVIGVCPDDVSERYKSNPKVSFSGKVDSIVSELMKCKILLAPFAYGTGIKTKVLEAMGMGVPVVTNSIGIEGMTCEPGIEVEIAETAKELSSICANLLGNPEQCRAVGLAGKAYVRRCHDWNTSIENLGRCLEFALNGKARS
ncbi:glycosyltransferase family 4 protein [Collinsella sp. HCP28S3_E12]|uniref:glycosyltransferase family 4 protein n=1 Tax=Collinsella sp. HCP28S3_E12 TaxID=3438921 RepID=UPI003F8B125F